MADSDTERTANEESEAPKPSVGTDPGRTPHQQGKHKKQIELDEEKVREHEREKARELYDTAASRWAVSAKGRKRQPSSSRARRLA